MNKEAKSNEILESKVFSIARQYFNELRRKDLGSNRTQCLLDFSYKYLKNGKHHDFNIKSELRGELRQYNLIVENSVPELRDEIEQIFGEDLDRWERRRRLKGLASKIAMNSISVNAYKFNPDDISDKGKGNFYFLKSQYYDEEIGFNYQTPKGTIII